MPEKVRVCAVITEQTIGAARESMHRAAEVADAVELRLDFLRDLDFKNPAFLRPLLEGKPLPAIITCRSIEEGGQQRIDNQARLALLVEGARHLADYCDIEAAHYAEARGLNADLSRLIVSYHNLNETPAHIDSIYKKVTGVRAAIHKIVTRAESINDCIASFDMLARARREGRNLIALAMGEAGIITRVLGPSRGCFLTYGSLGRGKESAPGQMTCDELVHSYRVRSITRETIVTGVIGYPCSHSASPAMHNRAFAEAGLDFVYLPMEVADLAAFFADFVRLKTRRIDWKLRGLSVTIPHKSGASGLLDLVEDTAKEIGAVNTIVISDGLLFGLNTDVDAAMRPLDAALDLRGVDCAIIGSGGAARAVVSGALQRGARVSIFARNLEKARAMGSDFGVEVFPLEAFDSSKAEVVINTTPVGMRGHSEDRSPVARSALGGRKIAYDLVYNPRETRFLKDARDEGCLAIGGLDMLVAQAALQFKYWTGLEAPVDSMLEAAMEMLGVGGQGPGVRAV
jgi:3-dehydroquinate dehydratase/shikimate dehydrogenase